MYIEPYHRDQLSGGEDHSSFGRPIELTSITDAFSEISAYRRIERLPDRHFQASSVYGDVPADMRFFSPARAKFIAAGAGPIRASCIYPDHGIVLDDNRGTSICQESLWHSELFFSQWFRNDRSTDWRWRMSQGALPTVVIEEPCGIAYHRYSYQYFHWFMDVMPRIWILKKIFGSSIRKWFIGELPYPFQAPSLSLFDIELSDVVEPTQNIPLDVLKAFIPGFHFVETNQTLRPDFNSGVYNVGWSAEYCEEIRDRAFQRLKPCASKPAERIYVARGDATHRKLINEDQVLNLLGKYGFMVITPGSLSFSEQVAVFSGAKVIFGAHGAGLTNILWSRPGAAIIEFLPSALLDVGYRFLAPLAGHSHGAICCRTLEHPLGPAYANIEINISVLEKVVRSVCG